MSTSEALPTEQRAVELAQEIRNSMGDIASLANELGILGWTVEAELRPVMTLGPTPIKHYSDVRIVKEQTL